MITKQHNGRSTVLGITLVGAAGIGDKLQFASFPENYFRNTGEKVIDLDLCWVFDHNPFVVRGSTPTRTVNLWTLPWRQKTGPVSMQEFLQKPLFFSHAERTASIFNQAVYLRHPRLYRYEDLSQIDKRLVIHTTGSPLAPIRADQGEDSKRVLSEEIIEYIRVKYKLWDVFQVGSKEDIDAHVHDFRNTESIWDVAKLIAQASMFIGVDSGPSWIAACYPAIFKKKVLMQYPNRFLQDSFVPMHLLHPHQHWHDLSFMYYNRSPFDAGITYSYLKL